MKRHSNGREGEKGREGGVKRREERWKCLVKVEEKGRGQERRKGDEKNKEWLGRDGMMQREDSNGREREKRKRKKGQGG